MIKMNKKKDGTLSYRVKVYVDGEQVTKTFVRKKDAELWKQQMIVDRERGVLKLESKECQLTFGEFSQQWLETKVLGIALKSRDSYQTIIKHHLLPKLASKRLIDIGMKDGHQLIAHFKALGKSPKGINMVMGLLKAMLNDAVRWEIIEVNRIQGLRTLKVPPKTARYWMPDEIRRFLDATRDTDLYELWVVALNTGMRRGELAGLCWDKVDFSNKLIHVARQRDRHGLQDSTKTATSFRYVPMNSACLEGLQRLRAEKRHPELVFVFRNGTPIDVQHITERDFREAMEKAQVPKIRFHDLRGTFAANVCMAPDGDLYALSKILGHSSVDMTVKRYAHLHNDFLKKVAGSVNFA